MVALNTTAVAWVLCALIIVGWLVYLLLNVLGARRELGSEIEVAPNRKQYYDDDVLEGPRLEHRFDAQRAQCRLELGHGRRDRLLGGAAALAGLTGLEQTLPDDQQSFHVSCSTALYATHDA